MSKFFSIRKKSSKLIKYVPEKSPPPIHVLPDKLLFAILRLLPAGLLFSTYVHVCKRWYRVICEPSRWSVLDIASSIPRSFAEYMPTAYSKRTFALLKAPAFCQIGNLRLGNMKYTNQTLRKVFRHVPHVETFTIRGCRRLKGEHLQGLGSCITKLDLSLNPKLKNVALRYVAKCCHKLRILNLRLCISITDKGLGYLDGLTSLASLNLEELVHITDAGLITLFKKKKEPFESIMLKKCLHVTGAGVAAIASAAPELKHINLSCCKAVDSHGFDALAAFCPKLEALNMSTCELITLESLKGLKHLTSLKELNLGRLKEVDNSIIDILTPNPLVELNVRGSSITDSALEALSTMTTLRSLNLRNCAAIRDLSPLKSLTSLTTLKIAFCQDLQPQQPVLSYLPSLEVLDLRASSLKVVTDNTRKIHYRKVSFVGLSVQTETTKFKKGESYDRLDINQRKTLKPAKPAIKKFDSDSILIDVSLLEGENLLQVSNNLFSRAIVDPRTNTEAEEAGEAEEAEEDSAESS